jgi:hypothetical protein
MLLRVFACGIFVFAIVVAIVESVSIVGDTSINVVNIEITSRASDVRGNVAMNQPSHRDDKSFQHANTNVLLENDNFIATILPMTMYESSLAVGSGDDRVCMPATEDSTCQYQPSEMVNQPVTLAVSFPHASAPSHLSQPLSSSSSFIGNTGECVIALLCAKKI